MSDEQDQAEALDWDEISAEEEVTVAGTFGGDRPPDFPPDRPLGSLDDTVTPRLEEVGESLADRVEREEPDPLVEELDGHPQDHRARPSGPSGAVPAEVAAMHTERDS